MALSATFEYYDAPAAILKVMGDIYLSKRLIQGYLYFEGEGDSNYADAVITFYTDKFPPSTHSVKLKRGVKSRCVFAYGPGNYEIADYPDEAFPTYLVCAQISIIERDN